MKPSVLGVIINCIHADSFVVQTVVRKYGGTSVADAQCLQRIAQTLVAERRTGINLVVVVSAMGHTTDTLLQQAHQVAPQPSPRELDMLVSAGERITMALLSMAIEAAGGKAISLTGSQSGIITDEHHQGARILEVRPQRIEQALAAGFIVIVAGFQGVSRQHEITTLGRGGSDTTAVALAAALRADICEICSDVDGVYSTDPRFCAEACLLPEVSYQLMHNMAQAGAEVLNATSVAMAEQAQLPLIAKKTNDTTGTCTRLGTFFEVPGVRAVVGAKAAYLLHTAQLPVQLQAIEEQLSAHSGRILSIGFNCLLLDLSTCYDIERCQQALALATASMGKMEPVGVVGLLGKNLYSQAVPYLKAALKLLTVDLSWRCMGDDTCLYVLVDKSEQVEVLQRLHAYFVSDNKDTSSLAKSV